MAPTRTNPNACGRALQNSPGFVPGPELERQGSVVLVSKNKALFEEGDSADYVYKVVGGALRTVRFLPDGRRHIASFFLPGDIFGYDGTAAYAYGVEAAADATVIRYPRHCFETMIENDSRAARRFLALVCGELASSQERLLLLGRKSAVERLATFLLGMADRMRSAESNAPEVDLPMSRSDIADYLGMTVETVSRVLAQLRSTQVIDLPAAAHIVLLKRQALAALSAGAAA